MRRRRIAAVLVAATVAALAVARPASAGVPAFPSGFHWGVAIAGFQSEGSAPDSNWSRYVAAHTGSIKDPYQDSVDFRHRYPQDIALAKSLGVNTFRFSVEWARVEPHPGVWDATELAYYDDVVRQVRAAGMTPMITLSHFVHPGWISDQGGWTDPETVGDFVAFSRAIVNRYRGLGVMWITFNEPLVYLELEVSNGGINPLQIPAMQQNLVAAHRQTYDLIHQLDPGAPVTTNTAYIPAVYAAADLAFLDQVADKLDFFGLDFYYGATLGNATALNELKGTPWTIRPEPKDLYWALKYYHAQFPTLPMYVVENGMVTDNGQPRADGYTRTQHLRDHVYWMQRARADGVPVIGYNYWSLTDNYEWGSYEPRFGLYTVNVLTDPMLTRHPTDAVAAYRAIIAGHGVPAGYQPVNQPNLCSLAFLPWSCLQL
jgi:beta-glucosidase